MVNPEMRRDDSVLAEQSGSLEAVTRGMIEAQKSLDAAVATHRRLSPGSPLPYEFVQMQAELDAMPGELFKLAFASFAAPFVMSLLDGIVDTSPEDI